MKRCKQMSFSRFPAISHVVPDPMSFATHAEWVQGSPTTETAVFACSATEAAGFALLLYFLQS